MSERHTAKSMVKSMPLGHSVHRTDDYRQLPGGYIVQPTGTLMEKICLGARVRVSTRRLYLTSVRVTVRRVFD